MNSPKNIALTVVAVLIIGGIALALSNHYKSPVSTFQSTPAPSTAATNSSGASQSQSQATSVSYDGSSFSPAQITVKAGQTVIFKNTSSVTVQVDSDPHPIHTDDTDLNVGTIAAGQSKTVTVNKTGSFSIHNHLNPSQKGSITIQ